MCCGKRSHKNGFGELAAGRACKVTAAVSTLTPLDCLGVFGTFTLEGKSHCAKVLYKKLQKSLLAERRQPRKIVASLSVVTPRNDPKFWYNTLQERKDHTACISIETLPERPSSAWQSQPSTASP